VIFVDSGAVKMYDPVSNAMSTLVEKEELVRCTSTDSRESELSKLQLSERISCPNTKNPIVARANFDNFMTTPSLVVH